ncbi:MAG TPA: hypothetical protein VG328_24705 [Stellaceae bacterium]|jgi:cytochrome c|nr:hypothetical protein [Stellaceae bacterium]
MRAPLIPLARFVSASVALVPAAAQAADMQHSAQLFQACAARHNDRADATGPSLKRIVGRKAAALDDFHYDPRAKVKGNRMPFSDMASDTDIDDCLSRNPKIGPQ